MTTMTIVLIVAIGIAITLYSVTLREVIKKGYSSKRIARLLLPLGLIFITYLSYHVFEIQPADWAQIMLMLSLVSVTGIYAYFTFKMAEEMREQRYDAARPVVDIQRKEELDTRISEALAAESREPSYGLHCVLRNIGLGPALDVCSFIQTPGGERKRWEFGTLPTEGETERERLSLLQSNNNQWELVAYYRDVYGRAFKSSREISIDKLDNTKWNVGPLRVHLIKEEELP